MLRCESVSKSYNGKTLFQNLSFIVSSGEKIALVGRNGSGKTTLFRMIKGEEHSDSGLITTPSHYRIGLLSQHAQFKAPSILEEALSAIEIEDPFHTEEWKAKKILSGLGFSDEQILKSPETISGGFTLRLQLAKLLLSDPDLLLLDEPTNYLDIPTIRWLTNFLQSWKKEIITVSHDRAFLDAISTHTMGIHRESFMKMRGNAQDYFRTLFEKEMVYQKTVEKRDAEREKLTQFITRFGAKASKAKQAQSKKKRLEKCTPLEELQSLQELSFSFQEEPTHAKILLEGENLSFRHLNQQRDLFSKLSFSISPGDRIAIAGKNGVGKSTLLKSLIGEMPPSLGKLALHPSCKIGYFGQTNIERLCLTSSIEDEIARENSSLTVEEIRSVMGMMMLGSEFHAKQIGMLSGGEKSRVLLAKILASPINLLLLDEPTNHLDIESIDSLASAIEEFTGAVMIVSHSEEFLSRLSNKSLIFDSDIENGETILKYYPMGYEIFCSEIGWQREKEELEKKKTTKEPTRNRQERALQVQERSKAIKPIKERLQKVEERIAIAEKAKEMKEGQLITLSQNPRGDGNSSSVQSTIASQQKELHAMSREIDDLYATWEELEAELQKIEARFNAL